LNELRSTIPGEMADPRGEMADPRGEMADPLGEMDKAGDNPPTGERPLRKSPCILGSFSSGADVLWLQVDFF